MVRGCHVIMCAYGFWLPNDPRGSWSDFVGAWELVRFGKATTVNVRRSVAAGRHDPAARRAAKAALKYQPVRFTGKQAQQIGRAFGSYADGSGVRILACAILPEHVHLVVQRHQLKIESIISQLKAAATRKLHESGLHPFQHIILSNGRHPKMWARNAWTVYLNDSNDIRRSIEYVRHNPLRERKPLPALVLRPPRLAATRRGARLISTR